MPILDTHVPYLKRCIELANKAGKYTGSNPHVGAVLVYNNRIIGEGFHVAFGKDHAEINAINSVSTEDRSLISKAVLYVSLEPCSHFGKTPPCVHKIVEEGITEVVIGCKDPNPKVAGNGIKYLKEYGILVHVPFYEIESNQLIKSFEVNLTGLPYIILKWAQSEDNYIGKEGEQIWLSNSYTQIITHKWRSECDAIMVGKKTALIDKPSLNVRYYFGENPIKIVMDSYNEENYILGAEKNLTQTWIINTIKDEKSEFLRYIKVESTRDLLPMLKILYHSGVSTLLVEGGSKLLASFIAAGLWHEARIIKTKIRLNQGVSAPLLHGDVFNKMDIAGDQIFFIKNQVR